MTAGSTSHGPEALSLGMLEAGSFWSVALVASHFLPGRLCVGLVKELWMGRYGSEIPAPTFSLFLEGWFPAVPDACIVPTTMAIQGL